MIASDVTLRHWKCAEEGNEHLCGFTLLQHQSSTLEHSLSVTTTVFPLLPPTPTLWTTLYICKTNFSTRAHVLVREHRLHVNSGQMWGDMRSRDAVGFSESLTVGLLMSSAGNTQTWNTWALLFYLNCASPTVFFFLFSCACLSDLVCRHRGRVVSSNDVMALSKHWKDYLMGPWWSLVLSSAVQTVLFIVLKLWFPMGNFSFSFIVSLTKRSWINLKLSFT